VKQKFVVISAILMLVVSTLACGLPSISSLLDANGPVFQDNFDGVKQTWGTGTDADSSVEYLDGGLRFTVHTPKFFVWDGPNHTSYDKVHIEVTAKNNSADADAAFGIICNQVISDNSYYFAVKANGQYAIAKTAVARDDLFLTNDDQWADSDQITKNAASYLIGADCGNGTLILYVDGKQIASVQDSSYEKGKVALFALSSTEEDGADVTFDNFIITDQK
jgi:hypothetical protein